MPENSPRHKDMDVDIGCRRLTEVVGPKIPQRPQKKRLGVMARSPVVFSATKASLRTGTTLSRHGVKARDTGTTGSP